MGKVDIKKATRDAIARRRLAARATPGLPIDGDAMETRVPVLCAGSLMDGLLTTLLAEQSPFFDQVCEQWTTLFPDCVAKPGRWQNGHLFLYVQTSGQLFGLRTKLPKIKKVLATLPTAPKRFSVNLEIHGPGVS